MAASGHKDGAAVWFGIVVGLVILVTILIGAVIVGPQRSSETRPEIRIDRPTIPLEPKLPDPAMHRQVA